MNREILPTQIRWFTSRWWFYHSEDSHEKSLEMVMKNSETFGSNQHEFGFSQQERDLGGFWSCGEAPSYPSWCKALRNSHSSGFGFGNEWRSWIQCFVEFIDNGWSGTCTWSIVACTWLTTCIWPVWLFYMYILPCSNQNIAMENSPFIEDVPFKSPFPGISMCHVWLPVAVYVVLQGSAGGQLFGSSRVRFMTLILRFHQF